MRPTPLDILRAFARGNTSAAEGLISQLVRDDGEVVSSGISKGYDLISHNSLISQPRDKLAAADASVTLSRGEISERSEITPYHTENIDTYAVAPVRTKCEITPLTGDALRRSWIEGVAALTAMPPPSGFLMGRWQRIVHAAAVFIDRWTETAIACGWTTRDVFGCNPDRPDARFDCMGFVLLLDRCEIVSIDDAGADLVTNTGARQRFRRRPLPAATVSLWELGQ